MTMSDINSNSPHFVRVEEVPKRALFETMDHIRLTVEVEVMARNPDGVCPRFRQLLIPVGQKGVILSVRLVDLFLVRFPDLESGNQLWMIKAREMEKVSAVDGSHIPAVEAPPHG